MILFSLLTRKLGIQRERQIIPDKMESDWTGSWTKQPKKTPNKQKNTFIFIASMPVISKLCHGQNLVWNLYGSISFCKVSKISLTVPEKWPTRQFLLNRQKHQLSPLNASSCQEQQFTWSCKCVWHSYKVWIWLDKNLLRQINLWLYLPNFLWAWNKVDMTKTGMKVSNSIEATTLQSLKDLSYVVSKKS